jgi:hypothetical protein
VVPAYNMPGGRSRFFRYIWNLGTGVWWIIFLLSMKALNLQIS